MKQKHKDTYEKGVRSVNQIWGDSLTQVPPSLTYKTLGERTYIHFTILLEGLIAFLSI